MKTEYPIRKNVIGVVSAAVLTASICAPGALASGQRRVHLDAGTVIPVRLQSQLSSKDSQVGDGFSASVDSSNTYYRSLRGAVVQGVVSSAEPQTKNSPGKLALDFRRLLTSDGRSYKINGSVINLDNSVISQQGGRLVAKPGHRTNRLTYVGVGAGAGALASLLGGRLRVENVLLGAAAGYGVSSLTKSGHANHDVVLKQGSKLGVRLDSGLTIGR